METYFACQAEHAQSSVCLEGPLLNFRQRPHVCPQSLSPFLSDDRARENILELIRMGKHKDAGV